MMRRRLEPVRKRPLQSRYGQERAAGFDQRQPLCVVVLDPAAGSRTQGGAGHQIRAPSGTSKVTAAGNKR